MGMSNWKVTQEDGSETFYQFEDDDPGLQSLKDAAKSKTSPIKSVKQEDPPKTSSPALQEA